MRTAFAALECIAGTRSGLGHWAYSASENGACAWEQPKQAWIRANQRTRFVEMILI